MVVAVDRDVGHPLQLRLLLGALAQGLVDGGQPFQVVLVDDAVPGPRLLRVAGEGGAQVAQELHDRRLLTAKAPGVEVVREVVELRQHAAAAVVLPVGAAVLDPGVLVLTLEHLVHGEVARQALAVGRLLPRDERLAALGRDRPARRGGSPSR